MIYPSLKKKKYKGYTIYLWGEWGEWGDSIVSHEYQGFDAPHYNGEIALKTMNTKALSLWLCFCLPVGAFSLHIKGKVNIPATLWRVCIRRGGELITLTK